eukprot:m.47262 g.47262  ORF g.47262 m.47262 type:complete len:71 (+) comp8837_c0_seq1:1347-1559(+)
MNHNQPPLLNSLILELIEVILFHCNLGSGRRGNYHRDVVFEGQHTVASTITPQQGELGVSQGHPQWFVLG